MPAAVFEMGFRSQMLNVLLAAAKQHGEDSDPDHEVGDLQDLLRPMWAILTPEQQRNFLASDEVAAVLEAALPSEAEIVTESTLDDVDEEEWLAACTGLGFDTSFRYPPAAEVEILNMHRFGHLIAEPDAAVTQKPVPPR